MKQSDVVRNHKGKFCIAHVILLAVFVIGAVYINFTQTFYKDYDFRLRYADGSSDHAQLFYSTGEGFTEEQSLTADVLDGCADFILDDTIREKAVSYRIDPISNCGKMELPLKSFSIVLNGKEIKSYSKKSLQNIILETNHMEDVRIAKENLTLYIIDEDPYFVLSEEFISAIPKYVRQYNKNVSLFCTLLLGVILCGAAILIYFREKVAVRIHKVKQVFMKRKWIRKIVEFADAHIFVTAEKLSLFGKIMYIFSVVFFLAAVIVFTVGRFLLKNFSGLSMEEIIFHLKVPMKGTGANMVIQYFAYSKNFLIAAGILLTAVILLLAVRKGIRNNKFVRGMAFLLSFALFFACVCNVSQELGLSQYLASQMTSSAFIEEHYAAPADTAITFPEVKRNLIYIFLESMESTFISKQDGGCMDVDMIPELTRLAQENINFSESELVGGAASSHGTDWTIGAMVAQSAGIPLLIPIEANSYGEFAEFLPGAVNLGDILHENGYVQEIMVGSDLSFGGRRNLYTRHGDYQVYDLITARSRDDLPDDYNVWWGYEDAKLFSYAKEEIMNLAESAEPFNFTMLTADTHHIGGYVCDLCQKEHSMQYENVLSCSSRQVASFIEWIQTQDFYKDTAIIICGDHPTMDASYIEAAYDQSRPRKVYNCFINSAVDAVNSKNREFNTFDFFPTTLAAMGCEIAGQRLGLGTNLFSGEQTLAEKYGYDKINEEFSKASPFYKKNILQE